MSEESRPIERASVAAADADKSAALAEGLSELELPFRATLELRYRRGLPDSTIAAVAQVEEPEIVRQRSRALVWLAQRAGIEGRDAIETVESGLTMLWADGPAGPPAPPAQGPALEAEAAHEPATRAESPVESTPAIQSIPPPSSPPPASGSTSASVPSPKPFPAARSKRDSKPKPAGTSNRRLPALLAVAAIAVVLFIVVTGGSDDATDGGGAPQVTDSTTKDGVKPSADTVSMQMLPGVDIKGKIDVTMSGDPAQPKLDMKLEGLPNPAGEYRAWLYKSVIDSRSLGRARKGDGEIKATLPENWQDYPFIDVSIQEPGSIAHSGESISRIPTGDLPQP